MSELVDGGSAVVRSGFLTKQGALVKSWKRRYFVLNQNGTMQYFRKEGDESPAGVIDVPGSVVEETPMPGGPSFCFSVTTARRRYVISAESPQVRNDWVNVLLILAQVSE